MKFYFNADTIWQLFLLGRDEETHSLPKKVNQRNMGFFRFPTLFLFLPKMWIHLALGTSQHLPQNTTIVIKESLY